MHHQILMPKFLFAATICYRTFEYKIAINLLKSIKIVRSRNKQAKMKLSIIATVSAFTTENNRIARDVEEKGEKRYFQLVDMMEHYNSDFDERKYWAYGCHCMILGKLFDFEKPELNFELFS